MKAHTPSGRPSQRPSRRLLIRNRPQPLAPLHRLSGVAATWNTVFSGQSSGTIAALETYDVSDSTGRYVRIVGHGTSVDLWNSISEVEVYGLGAVTVAGGLRVNISKPSASTVALSWNG